jgi:Flp pilus assembly protein TadD
MAKPILVTLPAVLWLLDVWPLARVKWTRRGIAAALVEKTPFVILALAAVAILLHPMGAAPEGPAEPGFTGARWLRAAANTVVYLRKLAWPADLTVLYPLRPDVPVREAVTAVAVLLAVTLPAWRVRGPLLVGWLWFLVMLLPVSGVMPIGPHEQADRYAYLPAIGIFIMVAWLVPARCWARPRRQVAGAVAVAGLGFGLVAWWQVGFWQNSLTLWTRAVALGPPSAVQQMNYGNALSEAGRTAEAEQCFERVAALRPADPPLLWNLATIRNQRGDTEAAITLLEQALRMDPQYAAAHGLLGSVLQDAGRIEEARRHLQLAISLDPALASAYINLGVLLVRQDDALSAEKLFATAARMHPDDGVARQDLALVREQLARARLPAPH